MPVTTAQPKFLAAEKLLPLLILAITCAVFIPSLSNGFVNWDDNEFIYDNPNVLSLTWPHLKGIFTTPVTGGYSPLVILSFALEKLAFGLNPGVFHLNNLLLHLLCVFLVYRLLQKLDVTAPAAAFGALLFGITPMHVESVAWITERKDVLYSAFYFGALLAYVRYLREGGRKFYITALILFALSLFAKIQAVTLPLSMLLLDYYFKRPAPLKLVREKIPFFALALAIGLLGLYMLNKTGTLNSLQAPAVVGNLFIAPYAFWVYFIKAIVPYRTWPLYPRPTNGGLIFIAMFATMFLIPFLWRAHRLGLRGIVFGFLFFAANIVFMLQIVSAGNTFLADRYSYVAYFGLFFLAAKLFDFTKLRPVIVAALVIYICALAALTWRQFAIWENGETLWTFVMQRLPQNPVPCLQRAYYYHSQAETAPVDSQQLYFTKSIADYDRAVALVDGQPDAAKQKIITHNSRAKTLFDAGKTEAAIADYTKVIALDSSYSEAYINRAAAYAKLGHLNQALTDLNHALTLQPNNLGALFTRALVYNDLRKPASALQDLNTYIANNPTDGEAYLERSKVNLALGKTDEALQDANSAKNHGTEVSSSYLNQLSNNPEQLHR